MIRAPIARRTLLAGGAWALASGFAPAGVADPFAAIERRHGGRLGVFAIDLHNGRSIAHRPHERFKLYSSFKALLAALVLADVAAGRESLDAPVRFGASDLLPASPVTRAAVARGQLSVRELCEATMHRSDNAAANLLMARRGGPARLTAFLRDTGDDTTRIDSYEGQIAGKPAAFDTSTPHAIAATARRLLFGSVLPPAGRERLAQWMVGNQVGGTRLRATFPRGWTAGDRTGTGDGYCNDIAFARRPGRAPLIVAAYYHAPGMAMADAEAVLRLAGDAVVRWQA